jgi:hypothetical protein
MLSKSMPPLRTLVTYKFTHTHTLDLILLLYRELRFLSLRAFTVCYFLSVLHLLQTTNPKHQNNFILLLFYLSNLLTTTFSSSWVRESSLLKSTTIDFLQLGAINNLVVRKNKTHELRHILQNRAMFR